MTASNTITVLNNDIVCGRGRGFEIFPGNQTFRRIIYENATSYAGHLENRSEKSILIKLIASKISENNMRFVKRAKRGWSLLGENEVKLKIGHALRDVAPLQRKSDKRNHKRNAQNGGIKDTTCSHDNKHVRQVSFTIFTNASDLANVSSFENQETSHENFEPLPLQAEPSEHILADTASITHNTTNKSTHTMGTCGPFPRNDKLKMSFENEVVVCSCIAHVGSSHMLSASNGEPTSEHPDFSIADGLEDPFNVDVTLGALFLAFLNEKRDESLCLSDPDVCPLCLSRPNVSA